MTLGALVGVACADDITMIMPAARATEPFRPALLRQRLRTSFFRSIPFLPIQQISFQFSHDSTPYIVDLKAFGRNYYIDNQGYKYYLFYNNVGCGIEYQVVRLNFKLSKYFRISLFRRINHQSFILTFDFLILTLS